jgi:hypothetical protein
VTLPPITSAGLGLATSVTSTSVVATVINYAASLTAPSVTTNGQFQFTINGVNAQSYTVQTSTNLSLGIWTPVLTNPAPYIFQESNGLSPQRFYRVIYVP